LPGRDGGDILYLAVNKNRFMEEVKNSSNRKVFRHKLKRLNLWRFGKVSVSKFEPAKTYSSILR